MRPENLKTKIFLDSGDTEETKKALEILGFLDGQTTNPSLIAKTPEAQERLAKGDKFSHEEINDYYRGVVTELARLIPEGSISVEVYSDSDSLTDEMFEQAKEMYAWIPDNAYIKYPTTVEGLEAAAKSVEVKIPVNMTLCFSQEQAAAIYSATKSAGIGKVYCSPFIGRLDDRGENGMEFIENILKMYSSGDGHVEVLTASVRNLNHHLDALSLGSDIITAPFKVLKEWAEGGMVIPDGEFQYKSNDLSPIPYKEIDINSDWTSLDIQHDLTDVGMEKFTADWKSLLK